MGRKANKRKRDMKRSQMLEYLAEATAAVKGNYTAKAGDVIKGNLARGAGGKFVNAVDAIKSGKPLAMDIGIDTEALQGMLAMSGGKTLDDGDVYDKIYAMGLIGDDGKLNARGRSIMSAVKKNDLDLAKKLSDKYVAKKAAPKGGGSAKPAQAKPQPKQIDAKAEAAQLAKDTGTDVKKLNNLLDLDGGGQLDAESLGALQQWGAVTIKDGKMTLTDNGKALAASLKSGDRKTAKSTADTLNKASKPAKKAKPVEAELAEKYKLSGKCVVKAGGTRKKCFENRDKAERYYKRLLGNDPQATAEMEGVMEYDQVELWEATKTIDGMSHPAGDFLAVGDPEKPGTWHLPYKKNGKPDRTLAGAAWAALFNPNGFRGNKYEGPDKGEAQSKLKAVYKSEEWPMPNEASENAELGEFMGGNGHRAPAYIPYGVTSFADLQAAMSAQEAVGQIREYAGLIPMFVDNIMGNAEISDKQGQVKKLVDEFVSMVGEAMAKMGADDDGPDMDDMAAEVDTAEDGGETLAIMSPTDLAEADTTRYNALIEGDKPTHAYIDIVAIQPGWGNKRDNHYYPAEVVASEATRKLFVGAKMYESEHNPSDKNNRTWVSTVVEAVGMHKSGGPIYRVAVHDPYFSEKANNLKKMGLLHMLECSIQGEGMADPDFVEGSRRGKRLKQFVAITNIDWVTKAGAGGHALQLVENSTGGTMDGQTQATPATNAEGASTPTPAVQAPVAEAVAVNEQQAASQAAVQPVVQPEAPHTVEAAEVTRLLEASSLPEVSRKRLQAAQYTDTAAVQTAIQAEIDYLKEATGSGKPVGVSGQASPQSLAEVEQAKAKINERFLSIR